MRRFLITALLTTVSVTGALAQHPHPQPMPGASTQSLSADGITTTVATPVSPLPVGQNFLLTADSNVYDKAGNLIPNTEPSTPSVAFNLMSTPTVTAIDQSSPTDDLDTIFKKVANEAANGTVDTQMIQLGINILEGDAVPNRPTYSGISLLHYTDSEKIKSVQAILDANGNTIGGNVNVHQVWFDNHIESDTAMIDPTAVQNVSWTITYTIDVLHRGADDFSPYVMYFDAPKGPSPGQFGPPGAALDATFYPMHEGNRYVFTIAMAPAKYWNLTYTWGWREHPPRVQVVENALKSAVNSQGVSQTLPQWETSVFGGSPRMSRSTQLAAIAKIGELSPAKIMWNDLNAALTSSPAQVLNLIKDARLSFEDWKDRTHLPRGVTADPNADVTLFYVNNTIYGTGLPNLTRWQQRGATFNMTLLNGDHFAHGYMNVDFGGARGWENQFQSSYNDDPTVAQSTGCTFTFGRDWWWINAGGPWGAIDIPVVSADGSTPGVHKVQLTVNFEPSQRLRMYQFDPYHHDVAVYSMH